MASRTGIGINLGRIALRFHIAPSLPVAVGDRPRPVVLGHFLFVHVHPCPDGSGRIGRFLMNVMMVAGGWPWTIIPVERRDEYMAALEAASVRQEIGPFADFLAGLVGGLGSGNGGRGLNDMVNGGGRLQWNPYIKLPRKGNY